MYAVIFTAIIKENDEEYLDMAKCMRAIAKEKYNCLDFQIMSDGEQEIAISYWPSLQHIENWKNDPEHIKAQALGRQRWYDRYKVQIVCIERQYEFNM